MHSTDPAADTDPHKTHSFEAVLDAEIRGMLHARVIAAFSPDLITLEASS